METTTQQTQDMKSWEVRRDNEKREYKQRMNALYEGIVKHLDGWSIHMREGESDWDYRLTLVSAVNGQAIWLKFGSGANRGKIHVSGSWPVGKGQRWTSPSDVREESPSINVTESRGYEAIAREIKRRFLPEYIRIFTKLVEKIERDEAYEDRKLSAWQRIAKSPLLGGSARDDRQTGYFSLERGYGTARMEGDDSVTFELRSMPLEMAQAVLTALETYNARVRQLRLTAEGSRGGSND